MSTESLVLLVLTALIGIIAWIGRSAIRDLRSLERHVSSQAQKLPIEYVRKEDYHRDLRELKDMIQKVLNKLDEKADKR